MSTDTCRENMQLWVYTITAISYHVRQGFQESCGAAVLSLHEKVQTCADLDEERISRSSNEQAARTGSKADSARRTDEREGNDELLGLANKNAASVFCD
ncbi:hypothetical protein R1flu_017908 [Riccia fluitans]|uniref:Uncharacterized protein n=1 Tax=Riccia fluitans TaxID=41844 RepID=A0ABD1ZEL1_9MARC